MSAPIRIRDSFLDQVLSEVNGGEFEPLLMHHRVTVEDLDENEDSVIYEMMKMLYEGAEKDCETRSDFGDGKGWITVSSRFSSNSAESDGYDVIFATKTGTSLHQSAIAEVGGEVQHELFKIPQFKLITPGWMKIPERMEKRSESQ